MIIRYRKRPLPLQKIDALISRLPENHPKMSMLRREAAKQQKGYNGERKLDYYIETMSDDYSIIQDTCFRLHDKLSQIDSQLVSRHDIFDVEVKSMEGVVVLDTTLRQCYREIEGEIERYKYPITQVEMIQSNVLRFLQLANLNGLPVYYLVAFSERSTYLHVKGEEGNLKKVITFVEDVPLKIAKINDQLIHKNPQPKSHSLRNKIVQYIMNHCEEFDIDIFDKYKINKNEILSGVHCPECDHLGMERKFKYWYCHTCSKKSKNAHEKSLKEYQLLYENHITNLECRQFLQINSRHTAKYLLQKTPYITKHNRLKWVIQHT